MFEIVKPSHDSWIQRIRNFMRIMPTPSLDFPFLNRRTDPLQGLPANSRYKARKNLSLFRHRFSWPESETQKFKSEMKAAMNGR